MHRIFANCPGDRGSISGWVKPKTQKMVLDASLLNTQNYKVRVKGKQSNSGKGIMPSLTYRCSSYWKMSLRVALDNGRQLTYSLLEIIYVRTNKLLSNRKNYLVLHYGYHPCPFVLAPVGESLCLFWHETHTKGLSARPEGRSQRRQRESVDKGGQKRPIGLREQSTEVSIPSGFVGVSRKIHACNCLQIHEELHKSVT